MRDNWCIGYTSRYTVGVWVGNFSGAPMRDVSGVTGAAPIWRDIVHWLHRAEVSARPRAPAGVTQQVVAFDPSIESERREWFVGGTAMDRVRANHPRGGDDENGATAVTPRIRYPAPGTIIALDPDIPAAHQRVAFVASPVVAGTRWKLDETEVPDRHGRVLWAPTPGPHTLVLEDARGAALSRVEFEVRGSLASASVAPQRTLTKNLTNGCVTRQRATYLRNRRTHTKYGRSAIHHSAVATAAEATKPPPKIASVAAIGPSSSACESTARATSTTGIQCTR